MAALVFQSDLLYSCTGDGTSGQGTTSFCECKNVVGSNGTLNCSGSCSKSTSPGIPTCIFVEKGSSGCTKVQGTYTSEVSTASCTPSGNNCVAGTWTAPVSIQVPYQGSTSSGNPCPSSTPTPNE